MTDPDLAGRVNRLSDTKRALLERLLAQPEMAAAVGETGAGTALPSLVPAPLERHQPFPLTDVQQAYWVGRNAAFELGNIGAHSYVEIEVDDFDEHRFTRALNRLVARHEMLRAVFTRDAEQRILPEVPAYVVRVADLREAGESELARHIDATRALMAHQLLAPDTWPLFEICATRVSSTRARLHISFDILVADVQSIRVISRDLAMLYQDPERRLEPIDVSFRDYVLATVRQRTSDAYRRSKAYWTARLPALPPAPQLPVIRPERAIGRPQFVRRTGTLAPELWSAVKVRGQQIGVTPSALVLTVFAEVLARWSASPAFTINLTLYNRMPLHPQIDEVVGDFTSLTLLAVEHTECDTLEVRARKLQEQLWSDIDHRDFSGVEVLRALARARRDRRAAAMPVVFTSNLLQHVPDTPPSSLGQVVYSLTQTPQVWLDHQVAEEAGALVFNWDAVEEIFPPGLLATMFDAYSERLALLANSTPAWQRTVDLAPSCAHEPPLPRP
ncbi:MAG: condensation domain-containing protein [Vicinamibacterales bacterium]